MCIHCHQRLNPEIIVQQLKDSIANPQFEKWNTTSLSHILLSIRGLDGEKGHDYGVIIADMFYKWYGGWSNGLWEYFVTYYPSSGLEKFPKYSEIKKMIDDAKLYYVNNKSLKREEMINNMFHD